MHHAQRIEGRPNSRWPQLCRAGVAAAEAAVVVVVAVGFAVAGARSGSLATAGTLAIVALALGAGLGMMAWSFAHGKRWPTGLFVTVQLLVAVIAISQGARSWLTFADNLAIAATTLAAVLLAAAGLGAVALGERPRAVPDPRRAEPS